MKKPSKKMLFVLTVVIISIISLMSLQAAAVSPNSIDDIMYSYEGMTAEKAEQIVKVMFGIPDNTIQPFNLLCLLGHSIQTGSVRTTEHNYYTTAPRCNEVTTYVEYCTRSGCDYFVTKSQSISRVGCH